MFGYLRPREEYIEKVAAEVIDMSKEDVISLTSALIKKASDYGLSANQIENVCARVNHLAFREKFAHDKLSTFNIAKIDDVLGYEGETVKDASQVVVKEVGASTVILKSAVEEEVEEEDAPLIDQDLRQKANLYDMAVDNADTLNDLQHQKGVKDNQLYETIKSLVLEGQSLGDIYEVLLKTWGEDNLSDINEKFMETVNRLKADGYMDSKEKFEIPAIASIPDRGIAESELSKNAEDLMAITGDAFTREYVHRQAMNMMKEAEMQSEAKEIDSMVELEILSDEILEKVAAIPLGAGLDYAENLSAIINPRIGKALSHPSYALKPGGAQMLHTSLKKIIPVAAVSAAVYFAKKYIDSKKYSQVRDDLLADPGFSGVDTVKFDQVFSTIISTNPDLLDSPYALGEIVKKHLEYGTVDASSLKDIGDLRKPSLDRKKKVFDAIAKAVDIGMKLET